MDGALELLKRQRPDAAVPDINLHGIAVTPVATTLREMNIPFAIASAYQASDMPADDALRDAVNVGKPFRRPHFSRYCSDTSTLVSELAQQRPQGWHLNVQAATAAKGR